MSTPLEQKVLVLNRLWQAVNLCTVERAMGLIFTDHAQVVHESGSGDFMTFGFGEWNAFNQAYAGKDTIGTVSMRIRVPRIILLPFYDKFPRKEVKLTRQNIFERDNHTCQYCHRRFDRGELNLDHVVPRHRGGETSWTNVVCSCVPCNSEKGHRTPEEAGLRLLKAPVKPRWRPFIEMRFAQHIHDSWRHFIETSALTV